MSIRETDPEASPDWCWSCLKREPLPDEYYQVCGECGHVFVTAEELLELHNQILATLPSQWVETDPEKVFCCPMCIHDF